MMIRRIVLTHYMSHSHTVIAPAAGLTVIVGPNNCGKSAIVSALQTLCYNAQGAYMVRHGEKEARVEVETEEVETQVRHRLTWRRRGGAVSYEIDGRRVDRIGRGQPPDDLHDYLKMPKVAVETGAPFDIHFGEQKAPIFLLDESPGRKAVFFASSSDAARLIEMQRRHRDKKQERRRQADRLERDIVQMEAKLSVLEPIQTLDDDLARLEEEHRALVKLQTESERLDRLRQAWARKETEHAYRKDRCDRLNQLESPPSLEDTRPLETLTTRLRRWIREEEYRREALSTLAPLAAPPEWKDARGLETCWRRLTLMEARRRHHQRLHDAAAPLGEPPAMENVERLAPLIGRLETHARNVERAERMGATLDGLSHVPDMEKEKMEALIAKGRAIKEATRRIQEQAEALQTIDEEMARVERAIRAWGQAHPVCPTCGAKVDVARLLQGERTP